ADIHDGPELKGSNQRPDTLMQDRTSANLTKSSCNARPDHTFGSFTTDAVGATLGRERLQFRGRCALAREVLERHQRLGAHARVVVVEQLAQVRHGGVDSGVSRPEAPEVPDG